MQPFCVSLQRTGLLSMVDVECSLRGTPESYVQKVRLQHKSSPRYGCNKGLLRAAAVHHFPNVEESVSLSEIPLRKINQTMVTMHPNYVGQIKRLEAFLVWHNTIPEERTANSRNS